MTSDMELAAIFKALSHPVRIEILRYLCKGPSCASLANNAIPVSQPNLSQHLRILREAGLVDCRKAGTKRCFYICRPTMVTAILEIAKGSHPRLNREGPELVAEIRRLRQTELAAQDAKG